MRTDFRQQPSYPRHASFSTACQREGTFVLHDNARVHLRMNTIHQDHEPEIAVYLQSDRKQNKTKQFCQAVLPWFNIEKANILRKIGKSDQNWKEKMYFIQNWIY